MDERWWLHFVRADVLCGADGNPVKTEIVSQAEPVKSIAMCSGKLMLCRWRANPDPTKWQLVDLDDVPESDTLFRVLIKVAAADGTLYDLFLS